MPTDLLIEFKESMYPVTTKGIAKVIREALARAFPGVAFTVRYRTSQTFISPSWVRVSWEGGPDAGEVETTLASPLAACTQRRNDYLREAHDKTGTRRRQ
jgi:hypothetical protein